MELSTELRAVADRIRATKDRVCWYRFEFKHPLLELPSMKTNRGVVLSVGPGRDIRRTVRVETSPGQFFEAEVGEYTGKVRPCTVKRGDVLEFASTGQKEHTIDGVTVVFSGEKSVIGYADENDMQGVMFPSPAGFDDRNRKVVGKFDY